MGVLVLAPWRVEEALTAYRSPSAHFRLTISSPASYGYRLNFAKRLEICLTASIKILCQQICDF
jgi:hypothetical protein